MVAQWADRYRQVVLGVLVGISQNLRYRWIPLIMPVNLKAKKSPYLKHRADQACKNVSRVPDSDHARLAHSSRACDLHGRRYISKTFGVTGFIF